MIIWSRWVPSCWWGFRRVTWSLFYFTSSSSIIRIYAWTTHIKQYQYFLSMKLRMYSPLNLDNYDGEEAYNLRCSILSFKVRYISYRSRRMRVYMALLYWESFSRSPKVRLLPNIHVFAGFYLLFGTLLIYDKKFLWSYDWGLVISLILSREIGTCSSYIFSFLLLIKLTLDWVYWKIVSTWQMLSPFNLTANSSCS